MSDADALLWTIGLDPVLRTTICAVVELDGVPDWETVRKRFAALADDVPTFRSAVRRGRLGRRTSWVVDPDFDLDLHLHRLTLSSPRGREAVLELAQSMTTAAFDPELPLWEAALVGGLDGGRAALVVKVHHAMVDGLGAMAMAARLLDGFPATPGTDAGPAHGGVVAQAGAAASAIASLTRALARTTGAWVSQPGPAAAEAWRAAEALGKLLAPAPAPLSPVMVGRGIHRRFEVLDLDLAAMRATATATGASVNDVFVNGVLGGLRHYHETHGVGPDRLRLLMPISVRAAGDAGTGNHFVPARFALPLDVDPDKRLRAVHRIAGEWKGSPALPMSDLLAAGLGRLPARVATALWGSMLKGTDACVTNVPGPPFETFLAGHRLERLYAFAPPSGGACNVALVTLAGRACVGVNVDAAAVPDTGTLASCLSRGFDEAGAR
ncbi:MAG TPA: wax ester/triacylglycerol synthase domain-containing protein [Acidimicrobiales bacterium]|nr:wax ester/triacylglycerol synthase domain-containing protein [Acidimicrobiales bacterium]